MRPSCQPPNCFQMMASRELFDSSGGLVTTNALVIIDGPTPGLSAIRSNADCETVPVNFRVARDSGLSVYGVTDSRPAL
jgi:hypothetical protein